MTDQTGTPYRVKLPRSLTAFRATPIAWHTSADIGAWHDHAYDDEFLAVDGKVIPLSAELDHSPTQLVINACHLGVDDLARWIERMLERVK